MPFTLTEKPASNLTDDIKIPMPLNAESKQEFLQRITSHEGTHVIQDPTVYMTKDNGNKKNNKQVEDDPYTQEGKVIVRQEKNRKK